MKSEIITFATLLSLIISIKTSYADTITFNCVFNNYSDKRGNHQYKNPHLFTVVWDKSANLAYQVSRKKEVKVKVIDSPDMISFFENSSTGNAILTSIIKLNGDAVNSRNILGMSSQAYGYCKIE